MAHTDCMGPRTGTGKLVCNPLVPSPIPYPCLYVVCTVKGILYKPINPGPDVEVTTPVSVPLTLPVPCSVDEP